MHGKLKPGETSKKVTSVHKYKPVCIRAVGNFSYWKTSLKTTAVWQILL